MSRVIKRINGREYYYYQTSLGTGMKPVTTYICPRRGSVIKLSERSAASTVDHMIDLFDKNALLNHIDYKFQHPPSKGDSNNRLFEYVVALNKFLRQNLPEEYRDIEQVIFVKYVHSTNGIEGNTLTQSEVSNYLYKDQSPCGKSHNELLQTRNHLRVKEYLDNYHGEMNEKLIKKIHELMMSGVDGYGYYGKEKAGEYRREPGKAGHYTISKPEDIQENIDKLIQEYHFLLNRNIHPINYMAVFHSKFERIHPFRDGNDRSGRAILDYMLTTNGFPSIYIPPRERELYLNALRDSSFGENYTQLIDFLIHRIKNTFNYMTAKSTMYHGILSDRYRIWFTNNITTPEYYNKMVEYLEQVRISEDDP